MRILITGTECTGKSTLAELLSEQLGYSWIPEYARTYLDENGPDYTEGDLLTIAQSHHLLVTQDAAPLDAVILDTYLLNIKIWSEEKYGRCHPWITDTLLLSTFDKVLLMAPDLPWIQDGLRENPTESARLHQRFMAELEALQWPFDVISGQDQQRVDSAMKLLRQ